VPQALLANMAGLYGVYHGPEGLTRIADRWVGGFGCIGFKRWFVWREEHTADIFFLECGL
jgi:hypothetical protein